MKTVKNIKEILIASLLLVTLVLPSYIQFSHQLEEDHAYITCHEQEDHVHENNVHCDLCNYHFTNFYFEFTSYPELEVSPIISKSTLGSTTPLCYYLPLTNTQLRAPPVFS
ncbi:hypothetical protein [uncultured Kordia sp.]|uniref:hypothetical protein n=1 Tax=uncultured Kordia sp. TaxID=507699 RepID=UPI0026229C22|nr:hypothetical protein [uncultured Kordia sp.]